MSKNVKHRQHLSSYLTKHRTTSQQNGYVVNSVIFINSVTKEAIKKKSTYVLVQYFVPHEFISLFEHYYNLSGLIRKFCVCLLEIT